MKKLSSALLLLSLSLLLCAASVDALGEQARQPLAAVWSYQTEAGVVCVRSDSLDGEAWLFLPACADLSALCLNVEGAPEGALCWQGAESSTAAWQNGGSVNWLEIAEQPLNGIYSAALLADGDSSAPVLVRLNVMKSAYLRSMHIFSDDPVNEGREWLEDCLLHEKSTSASLLMLRADGSVSASTGIDKLRGRGNSTWEKAVHKKPYQIKLSEKQNLLETGVEEEAKKKWVLLSNEAILTTDGDLSMLRNQIALDLSREFGMEETSKCEQVDLYYDERYRGTYLLCEKVEVNPGRLEITDFDNILEKGAKAVGIRDLEALPSAADVNRYGFEIHYTDGVPEPEDVAAGGYLVELERGVEGDGTLSDPAWFKLGDGQIYACKNPSMAGRSMVTYVSELMQEAYETFENYGVHPQTGVSLETLMDVESFTRSFLIQEVTQNKDAYASTSTNFVVRPGERRLYAGPVWDFDLTTEKVEDLRHNNEWSRFFYRTTAFQTAAKRVYQQELYPLVRDILLGGGQGRYLKPLSQYQRELEASWRMNYHRFFAQGLRAGAHVATLDSYVDRLRTFWDKQSAWLLTEIESWSENEPSHAVDISLSAAYGIAGNSIRMTLAEEQRSSLRVLSAEGTRLREATEDDFAVWQAAVILAAKPGCGMADDLVLTVNGQEVPVERREDGTLRVACAFEDPGYRPAVLDGVDYGAVFDFDYFADSYPELLEECGGSREAALAYFVTTGMDEGMLGNEFFDPGLVALSNPRLEAKLTDNWRAYYQAFLSDGTGAERFEPELLGDGWAE